MKRILFLLAALLLFAGCPGQKHEAAGPSIESISLESQTHSLSKNYQVFIQLSKSDGFAGRIVLYDNGNPAGELQLNGTENQTLFNLNWTASAAGTHALEAALEDKSSSEVSDRKSLNVEVEPLGSKGPIAAGLTIPVDENTWCAQKFIIENPVRLSEVELRLISLVPTREGKSVMIEIHNGTSSFPGENDTLAESAAILSKGVRSKPDWYSFQLAGNIYPRGEYWIVVKRDDNAGNLAWEYTEAGEWAMCSDISSYGVWKSQLGEFAYTIK